MYELDMLCIPLLTVWAIALAYVVYQESRWRNEDEAVKKKRKPEDRNEPD